MYVYVRCKVWACSKQGYTQFRPTAYPPTTRTRQINHPNKAERPDWRPGGHGFCALIRPFCLPPTPPRNTVFRSIWLPVLPPPTPPPSPFPHSPRGARWLLLRGPVLYPVQSHSAVSVRSDTPTAPPANPLFLLRDAAASVDRGVTPVQPCRREWGNSAPEAQDAAVQVLQQAL